MRFIAAVPWSVTRRQRRNRARPGCQIEDCALEALPLAVNARLGQFRTHRLTLVRRQAPSDVIEVKIICGGGCPGPGHGLMIKRLGQRTGLTWAKVAGALPFNIRIRFAGLALILSSVCLAAFLLRDVLTFDTLASHRDVLVAFRDAHFLVTLAMFLAAYTAIVASSVPGASVASLSGGFLFGIMPGTVINLAAASTGACIIFWVVRAGWGRGVAARLDMADGRIGRIKAGIDENQMSTLLLLRLLPVVPFFLANLVPAFLGISLPRFALTTVLGILPGTLMLTSFGAGLGDMFDADSAPGADVFLAPQFLWPTVGLCVLAALPILLKKGRSP